MTYLELNNLLKQKGFQMTLCAFKDFLISRGVKHPPFFKYCESEESKEVDKGLLDSLCLMGILNKEDIELLQKSSEESTNTTTKTAESLAVAKAKFLIEKLKEEGWHAELQDDLVLKRYHIEVSFKDNFIQIRNKSADKTDQILKEEVGELFSVLTDIKNSWMKSLEERQFQSEMKAFEDLFN